jgi:kinesin family protein 4/21/27
MVELQQPVTYGACVQVLLARQMEQNAKGFASWRKTREKEVQQLRRAGRKQAAHVQKLEALQAKQAAVLRRKTEEAEAARRRLKVLPS